MSHDSAAGLIDYTLERFWCRALMADPSIHDRYPVCLIHLEDFQARAVFSAIVNLKEAGTQINISSVKEYLENRGIPAACHDYHGDPDRGWFDAWFETDMPSGANVASWAADLIQLADARAAIIAAEQAAADDEPGPRSKPGPRAENTEPVRLAEAFRRYLYERDGDATLVRWARAWWRYEGTRYVEHDDEALDRDLIGYLDVVRAPKLDARTGARSFERVTSKQRTVSEVRRSLLHVMPCVSTASPHWTVDDPGDPPAHELVPCANGLLRLRTRELRPRTPRFFSTTSVAADWEPAAPEPTAWLEFLHSLWGDDAESILALQQMFGYLLTQDTSQQKMFALIGPPRSGKGTIARVLKALLGDDAVVNPTLASLEETFGLAPLVGKSVAIIGDARLGGREDQPRVVERLLSVSGEDPLSINRKNRDAINVRLRTRVLLLSNDLPRLYDTSGALASRFVLLVLRRSFLGAEDVGLERRLIGELPGIFRWAVDGYDDLQERGRFVVPLSSEEAVDVLRGLSSPLSVFLDDCCKLDATAEVDVDVVFARYLEWCKCNNRDRPGSKQWFGRDLRSTYPEIEMVRRLRPDGRRYRAYRGLILA